MVWDILSCGFSNPFGLEEACNQSIMMETGYERSVLSPFVHTIESKLKVKPAKSGGRKDGKERWEGEEKQNYQ